MQFIWLKAFLFNGILIALAQRIPLLTPAGWFHAGVLGTVLLGCLGWKGWFAVAIYLLLGSLVTKLGFDRKQQAGLAEGRGGRRGPENVWGSAATGLFLAILIKANFGPEDLLLAGFAASFAAKLADTFGSEIGKRWGKKAVLITTFRPVSPGVDGAISIEGTIASALGSFIMTFIMVFLNIIPVGVYACIVCFVGFLSTLLESLFGAIIQNKYDWISNELVNSIQTSFSALITILILAFVS